MPNKRGTIRHGASEERIDEWVEGWRVEGRDGEHKQGVLTGGTERAGSGEEARIRR